jgi:hypothetical protein
MFCYFQLESLRDSYEAQLVLLRDQLNKEQSHLEQVEPPVSNMESYNNTHQEAAQCNDGTHSPEDKEHEVWKEEEKSDLFNVPIKSPEFESQFSKVCIFNIILFNIIQSCN